MSYPPLNENLITRKGHPTDNMNLLESDILLGFDGEFFNDSLFEWLALNSNGNDI